jgi:hypothetical protein
MLGKIGFWITRPRPGRRIPAALRRAAANTQGRCRRSYVGNRLKLQIAEPEWPADTGQDVTGQPPGRPKRRRNSHEYYRRCAEHECN